MQLHNLLFVYWTLLKDEEFYGKFYFFEYHETLQRNFKLQKFHAILVGRNCFTSLYLLYQRKRKCCAGLLFSCFSRSHKKLQDCFKKSLSVWRNLTLEQNGRLQWKIMFWGDLFVFRLWVYFSSFFFFTDVCLYASALRFYFLSNPLNWWGQLKILNMKTSRNTFLKILLHWKTKFKFLFHTRKLHKINFFLFFISFLSIPEPQEEGRRISCLFRSPLIFFISFGYESKLICGTLTRSHQMGTV